MAETLRPFSLTPQSCVTINMLRAPKRAGTETLGSSREAVRLSTKIHSVVDALGKQVSCLLTTGQAFDVAQSALLVEACQAQAVTGSKSCDADALITLTGTIKPHAVIPPRANRSDKRAYDRHLYRVRNLVKRIQNQLRQVRRIATRHKKPAENFVAMINIACAYIWLA